MCLLAATGRADDIKRETSAVSARAVVSEGLKVVKTEEEDFAVHVTLQTEDDAGRTVEVTSRFDGAAAFQRCGQSFFQYYPHLTHCMQAELDVAKSENHQNV